MKLIICQIAIAMCIGAACSAQDNRVPPLNGRDVISVAPLAFSENGLGFGGSFERIFGKNGVISFTLPAVITFDVANSNKIYNYNTGNYTTGKADAMLYVTPGLKWYPKGAFGKIKYSAGLAGLVASGQKSNNLIDLHGLNVTENVQSHFMTGILFQNSLNVRAGKNIYLGVNGGVGTTVVNDVGKQTQSSELLVQGSVNIGYRF